MTVSDQNRHRLHQRLDEVLGADEAATLMEHLPPVGWADVATKRDLDHLALELRSEMATGFAEMATQFVVLRSDLASGLAGVRSESHEEIGGLRADLREEIGGLRVELHKEIGSLRADMARQLPTLFLGLVGLQVSAAGLAIAVARVV